VATSGIGGFQIGVSPIGGTAVAISDTVLSQYANSPVILAFVQSFQECIDPSEDIQAFYDLVWNVMTAKGYGLAVWGRIVGVSGVLQITSDKYLGFEEATDVSADPFGQSPLFSGQALTSNYALSDDAFRLLILAKAAANIWDGSIPGLNSILRLLFPGQVCYVTDEQDMTMTYTFDFTLSPVQVAVIANSGVLPRPCGVLSSIVSI